MLDKSNHIFCTQEWRSIVLGVKRKSQKCWRVNNQLTFRQIFVKILQIHKPCYITRSLEIHAKIKREFSAPKVCTSLSHLTQAVVFIQLKPFIYGILLQNSPMMMTRLMVTKEQIYFYHYKYADHCNWVTAKESKGVAYVKKVIIHLPQFVK